MYILTILFALICVILLSIILVRRKAAKDMAAKLHEIRQTDTNQLIHASGNSIPPSLINEVNSILKDIRRYDAEYQKKNHDLEQMMTNIAHDLRTPLTSAMGHIYMAKDAGISEEERSNSINTAEKRMVRLEELINSFFEFSKMISSGKEPETEMINVVSVLEDSVVHYYEDYTVRGRKIDLRCSQGRIKLVSNRNMLMRIFDNLIGNALKHGKGDLTITVSTGDSLLLTFENGLDDPELDPERVFDEFYTTDMSRTKGHTGLGLAISKQFTELLGGTISADCSDGRFRIKISFRQ
ncbi:MAG: HAMP domain-containing histidine kinase [Ruminococcus sp.]|nr:HAMP domain-containing histidine kinase [Ruminococcus sp.]